MAAIPWYLSGGIVAANCIAAYQAKNIGSQAASYVNQANPGTFDLTVGAAPDWTTEAGWAFNGTSHYLRTGVVVVPNLWSIIIWFSGLTQASSRYMVGARNTVPTWGIGPTNAPGFLYSGGNDSLSIIRTATAGVIALTNNKGYWNGVAETGSIASPGGVMGTRDLFIGARNADGTAGGFAAVTIERVAIYNITLTLAQIQAVGTSELPLS